MYEIQREILSPVVLINAGLMLFGLTSQCPLSDQIEGI